MRKFLLLTVLAAVVQISSAQAPIARPQSLRNARISARSNEDRPVVVLPNRSSTSRSHVVNNNRTTNHEKSLLNGTPLNSQMIGTAGNLLTITTAGCNQLSGTSVGPTNVVSFIHRSDFTNEPSANIAEYSLDYSQDGGNTWKSNVGPITNAPNIDNIGTDPHGRFPQGLIFNPSGNQLADSAYEVYSGTWHNAPVNATTGTWMGQMRGRGQFTGDSSTFNVHVDTINNGMTDIATGMCQGAPGVFWTVNEDWTGDFTTTSNEITNGIIVEKGVWNPVTRDVDWTSTEIHQQFAALSSSGISISAAQSFDIAFDPTGQIGWISCLGDTSLNPVDSTNNPIFWKTTDGGATWSGPMQINLTNLPGVTAALNLATVYPVNTANGTVPVGTPLSGIPTTSFEAKLTVDYAGNPHLLCTVGNGGGYSIESGGGYNMYDVTLNPADSTCRPTYNGWAAVFVDSVATLRGNTTEDNPPLTEDNRPLVSRSADGKVIFFFWSASDPNYSGGGEPAGDDNSNPNLFCRGFDVVHSTSTPTVNLTEGDANWGGATSTAPPGSYNGAFYSTVAPVALLNSTTYTIPLVLTQIDYVYNTDMSGNPAQFWYVNNINFSQFDFTNGLSATLTPIGQDIDTLHVDSAYIDMGATIAYLDTACSHSGLLHIVTNSSSLNDSVPGTYSVYYAAEDANGNIYATAQRTVVVVSPPVAHFSYTVAADYNVQFVDSSLYNPDSWSWTFEGGNPSVSNASNQIVTFPGAGKYYVCLTSSNQTGTSAAYCDSVTVYLNTTAIKGIDFASTVNLFPNPTSGNVTITLTGNATPDFTLGVYNVLGQQVIATSDYKAGTTNIELNAATLADGVYLVKIQSTQGSAVKRLIVSHK